MKRALLFLNGEASREPLSVSDYHSIYALDGAYDKLKKYTDVKFILGDLDSLKNKGHQHSVQKIHMPDQNYTDFEKSLHYLITQNYKQVDVYFGSGGEGDHYLGNLSVAARYHKELDIKFIDDRQTYFYVNGNIDLKDIQGLMVSIFPFPQAALSSQGLKWELDHTSFAIAKDIGIRNQANADQVHIEHHQGAYYLFINHE